MYIKSFIINLFGRPKYHCFIQEALTWGHGISIDEITDNGLTHHIIGHSSRHINRGDWDYDPNDAIINLDDPQPSYGDFFWDYTYEMTADVDDTKG